jgi:hypothetical protein
MDRYSSRERFGTICARDGHPHHVNNSKNPLPIMANGARRPMSCGPKRLVRHLEGTKANQAAVFLIGRPDADVYLLAVDLDCEHDAVDGPDRAQALAERINADLIGRGQIEVSRNRRGRYVWLKVRRSAGESIEDFKLKLNQANRALKAKYGHKSTNAGVGFDAIKGAPWHTTVNPDFAPAAACITFEFVSLHARNAFACPDWITDPAQVYRWHREHYAKGKFTRIDCLEEHVLHFGGLVTMPLHGLRHDTDGGEARWASFMAWEADETNVIASADLWELCGSDVPAPAPRLSASTAVPSRPAKATKQQGNAWEMLTSDDKLESMNGAAALAIQQRGIDTAVEDVLALYQEHGAATDGDTPARIARAAESLDYFLNAFDESKRACLWITAADVTAEAGLFNSMVGGGVLDQVNAECGSHLCRERLSLYGHALAKLIISERGAVATAKLHGLLLNLKDFPSINLNGTEVRAIFTLFERVGYITCTDRAYQFFTVSKGERAEGGEAGKGKCRQWDFAPNAPLPHFALKHVSHKLSANQRGRYLTSARSAAAPAGSDDNAEASVAARPCLLLSQNTLFVVEFREVTADEIAVAPVGLVTDVLTTIPANALRLAWEHCAHSRPLAALVDPVGPETGHAWVYNHA